MNVIEDASNAQGSRPEDQGSAFEPTLKMGVALAADEATHPTHAPVYSGPLTDSGPLGIQPLPEERYHMGQILGTGGSGSVRIAKDRLIRREVAVKTIQSGQQNPDPLNSLQEIYFQGRLQHPNILPIYDAGLNNSGEVTIVMQLIRGQNLATVIDKLKAGSPKEQSELTFEARLDIFQGVVGALSYAHSLGIFHCDIKPANVILGDHREVWIADWGISRSKDGHSHLPDDPASRPQSSADAATPNRGSISGTPRYMSPEQAQGSTDLLDEKSDLFSAFVLLYELLTLSDWISRDMAVSQIVTLATSRRFPAISDSVFDHPSQPPVPTELRYFLQRGLELDRHRRFQDCSDVLRELSEIRGGQFRIRCSITFLKRLQVRFSTLLDRHPRITIFLLLLSVAVWILGALGWGLYVLS